MKNKYDYFIAKILLKLTGIVFLTQLLLDAINIFERKPGYEWVLYACAIAFISSLIYSLILVAVNAAHKTNSNT